MKSIEEYHEEYDQDTIEDLKKCVLYIQEYVEKLYEHYEIHIDEDESEIVSENLYHTMLFQVSDSAEELGKEPEKVISDILEDFEEGGQRATGNMMALVGKAGTMEETRNPKITMLAQKIARHQSEL